MTDQVTVTAPGKTTEASGARNSVVLARFVSRLAATPREHKLPADYALGIAYPKRCLSLEMLRAKGPQIRMLSASEGWHWP